MLNFKLHLILNKNVFPTSYYYILGSREKYLLLNLSVLSEIKIKIKNFISCLTNSGGLFCFICFNKLFFGLTKKIALMAGQNYIVGNWLTGFFSKNMHVQLLDYVSQNNLHSNLSNFKNPVFFLVTSSRSSFFIHESAHFNSPFLGITSVNCNNKYFSYSLVCETLSFFNIYFYLKLFSGFVINSRKNVNIQ